jgi:hypothetical protein
MKTKKEVAEMLAKEKELPSVIQAALAGDATTVVALLASGADSLSSADSDGRTLMDYINELGLWSLLEQVVVKARKLFADTVITEPASLVAWMHENRALPPELLQMVPWEVLQTLRVGECGVSALEALSWAGDLSNAILWAVNAQRWRPSVGMLDEFHKEQASEFVGFARRADIFSSWLGRDVSIVDFEAVGDLVGEVKVVCDEYEHFTDAESYMVVEHDGQLSVVYGDFEYSPGDIFTLVSRATYQSSAQSAYAW